MNVKENISNILQAVGVPVNKKLSDADLQDHVSLRAGMRAAIEKQVSDDELNGDRIFAKNTLYDKNAISQLIAVSANVPSDTVYALISKMSKDVDGATDVVIHGMIAGLPEQDNIKPKVAEQSAQVLHDVMFAEYRAFLQKQGRTEQDLSYADFKKMRLENMVAQVLGDHQQAVAFLAQEIDENNPIFQDTALREKFLAAKEEQNGKVRVMDVLSVMSDSITKAQVLAFYENRVNQQTKVADNGARLSDRSPIKIDNALGHAGREATKQIIGQPLTNKMIPQTKVQGGPPLPEHKWRGYQKLARLIESTIKSLFAPVQTSGFVARLVDFGKKKPVKVAEDHTLPWDAQYQPMPENYQGTKAEEFFTYTQTRMMMDKVEITALTTQLADGLAQTGHIQKELDVYRRQKAKGKAKPDTDLDILLAYDTKIIELQNDIAASEYALADLQERAKDNPNVLQSHTLEIPQGWQAKDHLCYCLEEFLKFNRSQNATENAASYEMLADLFGIRDRFITKAEEDEIKRQQEEAKQKNLPPVEIDPKKVTIANLQDLLSNVQTGPFYPDKVYKMLQDLQSGALAPEKCRAILHDSAVSFLQDKYRESYTNYALNKITADILDDIRNK